MRNVKKLIKFYLLTGIFFVTAIAIGITATASGNGRKEQIRSKGIIDYAGGTIVIDSSDLTYLADEIDDLESAYKTQTVRALNSIGSYFCTDGTTVYKKEEETLPVEQAVNLSFQSIYEGIIHSQSVKHLEYQQAKDPTEALLYYKDEEAKNNCDLHSTTTEPNDYPVLIRQATRENLTAGTAAWVDGTLIIGNGADNQFFYESGAKDSVKNVYDRVSASQNYDDVKAGVNIVGNDNYRKEKRDSKDITYEIPLINEEGKMLYAVSLRHQYRAEGYPVGQRKNTSGSYDLTTKEGVIIDSYSGSASDTSWITKDIYIDLFDKEFSTEDDRLYLNIKASVLGEYTVYAEKDAIVNCNSHFDNIAARYK